MNRDDIKLALLQQVPWFVLCLLTLDGGGVLGTCLKALIVFWVFVGLSVVVLKEKDKLWLRRFVRCNRQLSVYNSCMGKQKITLETLDVRFTKLEGLIERGFGAIANDMATKDQLAALHTQVNSIERQLRDMKHVKLEDRVAAIEQELFGQARA